MRIIPAIDIIDGQCVRLEKGQYHKKKVYGEDPLVMAKLFEDAGLKYLHLVDLDGAKAKKVINLTVLEAITSNTSLKVDFGGGIKSDEDIKKVFQAGASQVTIGSIAVKDKERSLTWLDEYGGEKIILGADVLNGYIMISGWQQESGLPLFEFLAAYLEKGIKHVVCTDISKDGMLQGPSFQLYQEIISRFPEINLIASGGISTLVDLTRLSYLGLSGAIVGKAIYEEKISLKEINSF